MQVPWRGGPYAALDHHFTVHLDAGIPGLAEYLADTLGELAAGNVAGPFDRYEVQRQADDLLQLTFQNSPFGTRLTPSGVASHLSWHINNQAINKTLPRATLLHSAAVARDGWAIALPAVMESGKSTTTTGLVQRGWSYLTDEAVELDPESLLVKPFAKSIALDPGSWPLFPALERPAPGGGAEQWHVPPGRIRIDAVAPITPLIAIISPRYEAGAPAQVERLEGGEAVMHLSPTIFSFSTYPERSLRFLAGLARRVPAYRVTLGDLDEGLDAIEAVFEECLAARKVTA